MAGHRGQAEFRKPPAAFMAPAISAPAFRTYGAGGKPSTGFPPGGLVGQEKI